MYTYFLCQNCYRPGHPNGVETFIVHMLLPNDNETWSKLTTLEYIILTAFHNHWVKIVDFLVKAYFWASLNSVPHTVYVF